MRKKQMAWTTRDLRTQNRGLVLRLLRDHGPSSRAWLTRQSGLSATTITKIVGELIDAGLAVEGEYATQVGAGRPAVNVRLVPESAWVCGVQIGVGYVRLGLGDLHGRVRTSAGFRVDPAQPADAVLDRLAGELETFLERELPDPGRLLGIGVAAPGPVDAAHRVNVLSINLGWRDVPIADRLEAALGTPVIVDHNVRAMAMAEARIGVGQDRDSLAYVYLQTGVGLGLMLHGQPFMVGRHGVSELGHLRVVEKGRPCACGSTGCLETLVSEPQLARLAKILAADDPDGALARALVGAPNVLAALEAAAAAGDSAASGVLDDMTRHLTTALGAVVNLLNPDLIVLGGVFADAPEATYHRIRALLPTEAFPVLRDDLRIERSALGTHAGVAGGIAVALDRLVYVS